MELSIFITAHNEEHTIGNIINVLIRCVERLNIQTETEFILIDNGSTDDTLEEMVKCLQHPPIFRIIHNRQMKSYTDALKQGINLCSGKYIFFIDSDGQYEPLELTEFYLVREKADMIIGNKIKRRKDDVIRKTASRLFHKIVKVLFRTFINDLDSGIRIFNRNIANLVIKCKYLPYSFWTELTILAEYYDYNTGELQVCHYYRKYGKSKNMIYGLLNTTITQIKGVYKLWKSLH